MAPTTAVAAEPSFAAVLRAFAEAKNRHDLEAALSCCTDDTAYETVGLGHRVEGKDELGRYLNAVWQAMPDFRAEIESVAYADATAVLWGRLTGTLMGDHLGVPATGARLDVPVVFVCRFDGDLVAEHRAYFDRALVLEQAGLGDLTATQRLRAEQFVRRFGEGHAARDPHALGDLFHPGCRVDYPTVDGLLDREGVVAFWDEAWRLMPDVSVRVVRWSASGDDIFIEWEASGSVLGQSLTWRGTDVFTMESDRAVAESAYWDTNILRSAMEGAFTRA